jgi:hypothetical protein
MQFLLMLMACRTLGARLHGLARLGGRYRFIQPESRRGTCDGQDPNAIRPFHINKPEEAPLDLRQRIAATRWTDEETVNDESLLC